MSTQSRTAVGRLLERFLRLEAASGIVLLAAATLAIVWANSPMRSSYHHLWELSLGPKTLHFAINEGLMVIFFLVIGLEVRREIHAGELSEPRRAALPVVAALGGMLGPAMLYAALNPSLPQRRGWGVPTATDIAFAVGILALLGRRVPSSLRVLLLALAIIDDIGAVLLIAIFYSGGLAWPWLLVALGGVLLVVTLQRLRVSRVVAYVPCGVILWLGLYRAGVHPTMAGVILGLLTPAAGDRPPLTRLLHALHPWVAFGIMPLFALANAGVTLAAIAPEALSVTLGVAVALAVGKPAGVLLSVLAATKLRLVALPRRVTWSGIVTVGVVAGIGFTMSIFIAGLAFPSATHLNAAKIGVLIASFVAGVATLVIGRLALPVPSAPDIEPSEAESSTVE